jgi:hypothetical protein
MRKQLLVMILMTIGLLSVSGAAQSTETYTGTMISFPSGFNTRTVTRTFTLNIKGQTSEQQTQRYLGVLQESGQDDLLKEIDDNDLGRFSLGGNIGRRLNFVRESVVNGQRRIFIVFERWLQFAELRGGYRSVDYPFSVIELFIDERTGKGSGTFIPAARIRWNVDRRTGQNQVEIENFATYPAKLMGVTRRGGRNN